MLTGRREPAHAGLAQVDDAGGLAKSEQFLNRVDGGLRLSCIGPHLAVIEKAANAHVLTLSPPIALQSTWVGSAPAYTFKKYGMTLLTLGFAAEFRERGIAANALWPKTTIATAAVKNLLGGDAVIKASRTPEIVADAAYFILDSNARATTGNTYIDEDVLRAHGISDFAGYAVSPGTPLAPDIFLD